VANLSKPRERGRPELHIVIVAMPERGSFGSWVDEWSKSPWWSEVLNGGISSCLSGITTNESELDSLSAQYEPRSR
jgi:hypothetical protein